MGKVLSTFENGYAGAISRSVDDIVVAMANRSDSAIAFGMPVALSSDGNGIIPFNASAHAARDFVGVTVRAPAKTPDAYGENTASYAPGDMADILVRGRIVVKVTTGDPWPGDTMSIVKSTGAFGTGVGDDYLLLSSVRVANKKDGSDMAEIVLNTRNVI